MQRKKQVKAAYLLLAAIIVFALVYSIVFDGGPSFFGDDTAYTGLAAQIAQGVFRENSYIFSIRLLQIFPIALFYKLFGIGILTSSAWDITSFLGMIAVAFFLGKELYDEKAGLIASLLTAFFPLVLQLSATVSDDIPMAFMASLTLLALLYGQRKNSKKWYFAAGMLLPSAFLVTPEGIIVVMFAVLYLLIEVLRGKIRLFGKKSEFPYFFCGLLAAIALLCIVNYALSGNPLITFTVTSHFYSTVGGNNTIPSTNTDLKFYPQNMFQYNLLAVLRDSIGAKSVSPIIGFLQFQARGGLSSNNTAGYFFYAFVVAAAYLLITREKKAYYVLLWFLVGFGYLEFGPMHVSLSPFSYLLSYRLGRFLTFIAVPTALVIAIAAAKIADAKKPRSKAIGIGIAVTGIFILVVNAVPINMFWYSSLYASRYDQMQIAEYLSALPNTVPIYGSGAFALVLADMGYSNLSRFYVYDNIKSCSGIPAGSYVIIPKYQSVFGLNYTPNVTRYCSNWQLVLDPIVDRSFSQDVNGTAMPFEAKLYYIPKNSTTSTVQTSSGTIGKVPNYPNFNYFNLTGSGYVNSSTHSLSYFVTVNNVSSVDTNLNLSSAGPGQNITLSVTLTGTFDWSCGCNATRYYLASNVVNVDYFGVELANQTGMLLDQNNGPWYNYIAEIQPPRQAFLNDPARKLRLTWIISPTENATGKTLKLCGGYFATYRDQFAPLRWAQLYNNFSYAQKQVVNSTVISIPAQSCANLQVSSR